MPLKGQKIVVDSLVYSVFFLSSGQIPELEESERSPNSISYNQTKSLRAGDGDGLIRNPQLVL